jgi:hypothetical protein
VLLEGRVTVGAYTKIDAGTIITGNVTIGHHTLIRCNVTIRGTNQIGNYTHIYDNVCIEGGRPAKVGGSKAEVPDRSIIGDGCWINTAPRCMGPRSATEPPSVSRPPVTTTRDSQGASRQRQPPMHVDQMIPENSHEVSRAMTRSRTSLIRILDYWSAASAWTRFEHRTSSQVFERREMGKTGKAPARRVARLLSAVGQHDGQQKSDFQHDEHRMHRNILTSGPSPI